MASIPVFNFSLHSLKAHVMRFVRLFQRTKYIVVLCHVRGTTSYSSADKRFPETDRTCLLRWTQVLDLPETAGQIAVVPRLPRGLRDTGAVVPRQ